MAISLSPPWLLDERARTRAALAFADARHAGQRRDADGAPFMLHPLEVAALLHEHGLPDHVVAAGVLHDVIENTDTDQPELVRRFGPKVAALVACLSDDPRIADSARRKAALRRQVARAGREAAAIFAADKVSKVRELRMKAAHTPLTDGDRAKLEHYEQSLAMLDEQLAGHALVRRLRGELRELNAVAG